MFKYKRILKVLQFVMQKEIRIALFIILFLLSSCTLVFNGSVCAYPRIVSAGGMIRHGLPVTITGGGFGTRIKATPLVWEDFSDGNLDSSLNPHTAGLIANNTDNLRSAFNKFNARNDFKKGGNGFYSYDKSVESKWFVQYWIKLAVNWHWGTSTYGGTDDGLANIKFFRLFPEGDRNYTNFFWNFHGWNSGINVLRSFEKNGEDNKYVFNMQKAFTLDTWHCVQIEYGENSGIDKYDGHIKLWIDGILRDSSATINTNYGQDGAAINKRPFIIGFYDSWSPSDSNEETQYAYYADVYVDNTWARVEIGNNSTWSDCTHREIQIPSAWSDSSITVTVNQGSFNQGDTAYLYVIDSFGNVSNGFPIIIGDDGSSPNVPASAGVKEEYGGLQKDRKAEAPAEIKAPHRNNPSLQVLPQGTDLTKHTMGPYTVRVRVGGNDEHDNPAIIPRLRYSIGAGNSHGYFDMIYEGNNVWRFDMPDQNWYEYRSNTLHYQVKLFDGAGNVIAESHWQKELIDSFVED